MKNLTKSSQIIAKFQILLIIDVDMIDTDMF